MLPISLRGLCTSLLGLYIASSTLALDPTAVYDGGLSTAANAPIKLRVGNGGAGQSGLVKALADAFINTLTQNGTTPFRVAWYLSDTTYTIKNLEAGLIDVGITYSETAERLSIESGGSKSPSYFIFRDHFLVVGPPENPAGLKVDDAQDVVAMFSKLHQAAEKGVPANSTQLPVRWLSRYDKSATNIKESMLWLSIGQVPWATAYSTWYHQFITFPIGALNAAIMLKEYTLTDRGTLLSLEPDMVNKTVIYKASTDRLDDPLLNPGRLLIGTKAEDPELAQQFADWAVSAAGQKVVRGFKKNGQQLYSEAPTRDEMALTLRRRSFLDGY